VIDGLLAGTANLTVGDIDSITETITAIDDDLKLKAASEPSLRGMGSTLAMAVISAEAITVLNVGDSRVYLSQGFEEVRQISIDDIPLRQSELHSQDGPGDGMVRRSSHLVTQALGGVPLRRTRLRPHVLNFIPRSHGRSITIVPVAKLSLHPIRSVTAQRRISMPPKLMMRPIFSPRRFGAQTT
jgi:serine/threonine protein phosphatase PrpC